MQEWGFPTKDFKVPDDATLKELLKLADVNEAVTFVTDSGLRKEILELYQENGIEMIRGEQKQ